MRLALLTTLVCVSLLGCNCSSKSANCTVVDHGDGTKTISCPDGTHATVSDGQPGAMGTMGNPGPGGDAGTSCSVADNGDGTKTISCADGTMVTVSDGSTGDAGVAGLASLVLLQSEPPGPNCTSGGTAVLSGLDVNGDGVLQVPGEVQQTAYVCSCGAYPGSFTIATEQDWQTLVAMGCVRIAGDLVVTTSAASLGGSADVESVSGNVVVANNPNLTGFALPTLASIGGSLTVQTNAALASLSLPALTSVAGSVTVGGCGPTGNVTLPANPLLASVDLTSLRTAQSIEFNDVDALTAITLPALQSLSGDATFGCRTSGVSCNASSIDLPALTQLGGALFTRSFNLTHLGIPELKNPGYLYLAGPILSSLDAPKLETTQQLVVLIYSGTLTSFTLPELTSAGEVTVTVTTATTFSMPKLASVTGPLTISGNTALTGFDLPVLTTVTGALNVSSNPALRQCLADRLDLQLTSGPSSYTATGNDGMPNTCP